MGVAAAAIAAPIAGLSAGATTLAVGATAGTLTAGTTIAGNSLLGQQTDYGALGLNVIVAAGTAGLLKTFPGVRGAPVQFGTKAFFTGARTSRQGAEELFSGSVQSFGQTVYRSSQSQANSSVVQGGLSRASLIQQLQSIVFGLQGILSSQQTAQSKK